VSDHELVELRHGKRSQVPFVIAIHRLGKPPALGGCRILDCQSVDAALADALALSEAMTYKCAGVGLSHGGAKCVIVGSDALSQPKHRRAALLDVGDAVESLAGRFVTGKDAGTSQSDIETLAERTRWVVGRDQARGGSGDPSILTAVGVVEAVRSSCKWLFGSGLLKGVSCGVLGVGQVGGDVARRLAAEGAVLTLSDIDASKRWLASQLGASWLAPQQLLETQLDVLVPCALGSVLDSQIVDRLQSKIVVGSANNQLASQDIAKELKDRNILWGPDFIANAGGLLSVACEVDGYGHLEAESKTQAIGELLYAIYDYAKLTDTTTLEAAHRMRSTDGRPGAQQLQPH
jgi:leucine dehydrogenase